MVIIVCKEVRQTILSNTYVTVYRIFFVFQDSGHHVLRETCSCILRPISGSTAELHRMVPLC